MKYKKRQDNLYETTIAVGYSDSGKKKYKHLYARSLEELRQKYREFDDSLIQSKVVFSQYAERWFKLYKANKEINTQAMYQNALKHFDSLATIPISDVKKSDCQMALNEYSDHGRTMEIMLMTMKQIFDSAVTDHYLSENPAETIKLPKRKSKKKRDLYDYEVVAMNTAIMDDLDKLLVHILYYFGLRREEVLALGKNDFDFKKGFLTVDKDIVFDSNDPVLKIGAKSDAGNRKIPIPEPFSERWRDFIKKCKGIYIFSRNSSGNEPYTKQIYVRTWKRIINAMNDTFLTEEERYWKYKEQSTRKEFRKHVIPDPIITDLTAHIFRHNYATMCYFSGTITVLECVALMGHADSKMIMEIYAHLDEEKQNTASKINDVFRKNS